MAGIHSERKEVVLATTNSSNGFLMEVDEVNQAEGVRKMSKVYHILLASAFCLLFVGMAFAQGQRFDRSAVIMNSPLDPGGFGNVIAGVDFDNDGRAEIYAVNNDWFDEPGKDWVPRIHKYEWNGSEWEEVWSTELDIDAQNTWPPMTYGDWDKDGKMEIIWGPINNFSGTKKNPERVVVFESKGDGSDEMGVFDAATGRYRPNAQWTIVDQDNINWRPFRWVLHDIDSDGQEELIASTRQSAGPGFMVISVDNIPDNADSSETWTMEASGVGTPTDGNTYYDLAVIDSSIYLIRSNGDVTTITYSSVTDTFQITKTQPGLITGASWKTASVVDIDGDGSEEIVLAGWTTGNNRVWLLQPDADSVKATQIAEPQQVAPGRANGGAAGDVDGDGRVDFIFGSRSATPNAVIYRVEYQGGDITDPANYTTSAIDSGLVPVGGQFDVVTTGNLDSDPEDEIVYATLPRGGLPVAPMAVLELVPGNQPVITSILDVPNDQGRQVRVEWAAAVDDDAGAATPISEYSVWRRIDHSLAKSSSSGSGKVMEINGALWEQVAVSKAIQLSDYGMVVPTLVDRIPGGEPGLSTFMVVAHTADPATHWNSYSKAGFSVDNLVPQAPMNFTAQEAVAEGGGEFVSLSWEATDDPDVDFYEVFRGTQPDFAPSEGNLVGRTTDLELADTEVPIQVGETVYYKVRGVDFNKNIGEEAQTSLVITSVSQRTSVPREYSLSQNYPNPFNPSTTIEFSLKEPGKTVVKVYSILGQEVATLVDEYLPAGKHKVKFNAASLPSGVYFYVLEVNGLRMRKRMTLMK